LHTLHEIVSTMADTGRPSLRLPGASDPPDDPILAELFARIRAQRGHLLNIHRVAGHAPKLLRATAAFTRAMREEASVPRDLQELVIMRVAQVNNSAYEQSVHRPIAIDCGSSPEKVDAVAAWRESKLFDARERAALGYVEQAARSGEVEDATFAALQQVFSPQEIVELTAIIAWFVGNARQVRALRIVPEET
jgi:alkylhydroperoxidase family enzyme